MKSFSFRAKMTSLLVLILIIFGILGFFFQNSIKTNEQIIRDLYQGSITTLEHLATINNNLMTEVQMPIQILRTTGEKNPLAVFQVRSAMKEIRSKLANMQSNPGSSTDGQAAVITHMATLLDQLFSSAEDILNFKGDLNKKENRARWDTYYDTFNHHLKGFAQESKKLSDIQSELDHLKVENIRKSMAREARVRNILLIIGFLLILILPLLFIKDITTKYKLVIKYLVNLSKGNLTDEIPDIAHDEMGWILHNVKILQESLRKITVEVNTAAGNLSIASHDLSASSQSIAQGASEQASSVEEVSSSIEQLASNIHQVSDNAKSTEIIANKLAETTEMMVSEARQSQEKMNAIAEKIGIINEIAFQTNILALNAAVEAARAGEHGRGFGVVAVEVGKLAERSKKAATEIESLIHSSVEVIEQAGKMMLDVAPEVTKTAEMVKSISEASVEQKMGADQINEAIQQLNEVTQQNAAASEEIATSAEELSAQADRLVEAQAFFKLDEKNQTSPPGRETPRHPKKKIPQTVTTGKKSGNRGVNIDLGKPDDLDEGYEKF